MVRLWVENKLEGKEVNMAEKRNATEKKYIEKDFLLVTDN